MIKNLNLKIQLTKEYLENGGLQKILDPILLKAFQQVKQHANGDIDESSVTPPVRAFMIGILHRHITDPFASATAIAEYGSILQKDIFFEQRKIDTEADFEALVDEMNGKGRLLYRGMREAKFRLYSSLQRHWIINNYEAKGITHLDFLQVMIENARIHQNQYLPKFIAAQGLNPENNITVLAALQHYGCPTPVLDWTYSFDVALYFALDGLQPRTSTKEIDQYFSVYSIEESEFSQGGLREIITQSLKDNIDFLRLKLPDLYFLSDDELLERALRSYSKEIVPYMCDLKKLETLGVTYFSDLGEHPIDFGLKNNPNIMNQQGVLTWNPHPFLPIEHEARNQYQSEHNGEDYRFTHCFNINKDLVPYIQKRLVDLNITQKFIYPKHLQEELRQFGKEVMQLTTDKFII